LAADFLKSSTSIQPLHITSHRQCSLNYDSIISSIVYRKEQNHHQLSQTEQRFKQHMMGDLGVITAGVLSFAASITSLSFRINAFKTEIVNAKRDADFLWRELELFRPTISRLQEYLNGSPEGLPAVFIADFGSLLQDCNRTIIEIDILPRKSSAKSLRSLQWTHHGKRECDDTLREKLTAYKTTIYMRSMQLMA
jgi:hypothetical protein